MERKMGRETQDITHSSVMVRLLGKRLARDVIRIKVFPKVTSHTQSREDIFEEWRLDSPSD